MRLHIHDFSGHPFQVQLSRELAERGHRVHHTYSSRYASGKGRLRVQPGDPGGLAITAVDAGVPFQKYLLRERLRFEVAHTRAWTRALRQEKPELVVACNVPLIALALFARWARRSRTPWVLWHQDIYSTAMADELRRRLPKVIGRLAGSMLERLERSIVSQADGVVAISDGFALKYSAWGLSLSNVVVIPNWAPVDEITPVSRDNDWARTIRLPQSALRLVYAGTIGRKHNPELLIDVVEGLEHAGVDVHLVVASEGDAADSLRDQGNSAVTVLPFQPAEALKDMLGSADVLLVVLEPDASRFSIPSKVLSYLSAGRPILGLMPLSNPATADIEEAGGLVVSPSAGGVRHAVDWLAALSEAGASTLEELGTRARVLAERKFDITRIADRFESEFERAIRGVDGTGAR